MVKYSLKLFFPTEVNRDVFIGLRQHENMVIVWLDFLKNISLRFTALGADAALQHTAEMTAVSVCRTQSLRLQ